MPRQYCPRCAAEVPVDDDICFFGHDVAGAEAGAPDSRPLLGGSSEDERSDPLEDLEEPQEDPPGGPSIDPNAFTARSRKRARGLLSRLFG